MDGDRARAEIIDHLQGLRREVLEAIGGLTESQANERSIDQWSVKDHILHLAFWHELRASEVVRISAGFEHAWPVTVESDPFNAIVQGARANLSLEQAEWEYESSLQRAVAAVATAGDRAFEQSHYGEVGLRTTHDLGHADTIRAWRKEKGY